MFEGEVQFVGAGSGICFLPDEGGGSTEGVDGAGMVADPGSGLDWMVDTAGYGSGISGSGSQTYIFESILKIYGSGISGSGSQTYNIFLIFSTATAGMDSRTLQQLADQAQHEVDMASRMVREAELQARLARAELAAKNKTLRLLQREAEDARTVRNIIIPRVCMSMYKYEWNFCQ